MKEEPSLRMTTAPCFAPDGWRFAGQVAAADEAARRVMPRGAECSELPEVPEFGGWGAEEEREEEE